MFFALALVLLAMNCDAVLVGNDHRGSEDYEGHYRYEGYGTAVSHSSLITPVLSKVIYGLPAYGQSYEAYDNNEGYVSIRTIKWKWK